MAEQAKLLLVHGVSFVWCHNTNTNKIPKHLDCVHDSTYLSLSNYRQNWVLVSLEDSKGRDVRAHYRKSGLQNLKDYAKAKMQGKDFLSIYQKMLHNGDKPNRSILLGALKACTSLNDLETGMRIHGHLSETGDDTNIFVANNLVHMYCKCGSMVQARLVFEKMPGHDLVSWNTLIFGYIENGESPHALHLFVRMQAENFTPDGLTFLGALKACSSCATKEDGEENEGGLLKVHSLEKVMAIHSQLAKSKYEFEIFVANTLVDAYAKCGSMEHACRVFWKMPKHDLVSWNALVFGYAESEESEYALQLFVHMQREGFKPVSRTYLAAFKACACCARKEDGSQVEGKLVKLRSLETVITLHSQLAKGENEDIFVASAMVDAYARCGSMEHARWVFDKMPQHDLVSWTAMIFGYAESEESELALQLFIRMQHEGFMPDAAAYVAALKACVSLVAFETGKNIHIQISNTSVQNDLVVAASLIGFYSKCGSMFDAERVFNSVSTRDLVTWRALLAGYAHHGDAKHVFHLFKKMEEEGFQAEGITFLSIFNACSHAGLVDKGRVYFWDMCKRMIIPHIEHYACMVDVFGRANYLDDTVVIVKNMPFGPNLTVWMTILGACRKWRNMVIGRLVFEHILRLDSKYASAYVLMSNIYAVSGLWKESTEVHAMRMAAGAWKKPGQSCWTDNTGTVHKFTVGDKRHHQSKDIQVKLQSIMVKMKEQGYMPDLDNVLRDISDDEKESALWEHSERLAISCALLNTAPRTPIRVVKNLRVCSDCHNTIAIISKMEQRVVICRDASRFHVFNNGKCSCGDFW